MPSDRYAQNTNRARRWAWYAGGRDTLTTNRARRAIRAERNEQHEPERSI